VTLIMRHVSVIAEDGCQVQRGCRYDEAGHQEYGQVTQSAFWHQLAAIQSHSGDDCA